MGTMLLTFNDFLGFIVRASLKKYRECEPQESVTKILQELLLPLVEKSAITPQQATPETLEELKQHQDTLVALFCHYCAKEDGENRAVLGADYTPPEHQFRLGLQGLNMFAADSGLLKLISPQNVMTQFDTVLEQTGESSLRYTGWVEWIATIAHLAFKPQDSGHAILEGYNFPEIQSGADVARAVMQVVESSHETALVMHSRGVVTGQETTYFKEWQEAKDALLQGDRVTNSYAVQGARLAVELSKDGLLDELQHLYGFYCQSATDLRCDVINRQGFTKLLTEGRVLGFRGLVKEDAHIIYEKNVMGKFRLSKSDADSARKASKSLVYAVENKGNRGVKPMMNFQTFLESICELAAAAGLSEADKDGVGGAVTLVRDYVLANCQGRLMFEQNDAFTALMNSEVVQQVVQTYKQPLQALFIGFAQPSDRDSVMHWSAAERETCSIEMTFSQLWEFSIEAQLLPVISRKQLANVLLVASGGEASTCTYSQFEEILIRCAQLYCGRALSTPQELADAIVELFAHMDGSPAVRSVTANIGNTHSGTLRLVIEPSRRPFAKQQRGEIEALEQSLDRISAPGVRALNQEASGDPEHNLVPEYCEEMFKSPNAHKRGSPPWRSTGEEPWEQEECIEMSGQDHGHARENAAIRSESPTACDEGVGAQDETEALQQSGSYATSAPSMEDLEELNPHYE